MTQRLFIALLLIVSTLAPAQITVNASQQITLQGLRTSASYGRFLAAAYEADGSLILLYDQHDGVRLLKTNAAGTTVLAQSQQGATGDSGLALALDPSGNIYVTGTTTSTALMGSAGTAFPTRYDPTTNSFLAKYDSNLNPIWLTFLGAGSTASTALAATASGALVTGITYSQSFPVTSSAIQQTPSPNDQQNGFVESFTTTGSLNYATYLNAFNGSVAPAAIAADTSSNAYIAGLTTATGFPTVSALVPNALTNSSGFLTALNPVGSSFLYSTFIPGTGITSIALDTSSQTLILSGNIAPGQFPLTNVSMPLVSTTYQSTLRLPLNGQSLTASTLLVPGTQSFLTPVPDGSLWVAGTLTTPLFPGQTQPDYASGDTFLLHQTATNILDQTLRIGGLPTSNPLYATLTTTTAAPAVNGQSLAIPSTLTASTSTALLPTQHFDLPLTQTPTSALPSILSDVLPTTTACPSSSQCTGTAALLTLLATATNAPSLSLSIEDLPNLTLRNLGSAAATSLSLTATGYTLTSNCLSTLQPSTGCAIALAGAGPGSLTASATNAASLTVTLPATTLTASPITLSSNELDFGILTAADNPISRTLTLTNLTAQAQLFTAAAAITPTDFALTATTCNTLTTLSAPGNATCTLTITFTPNKSADTAESAFFTVAGHTLKLTGFSTLSALNLSSSEVDFGTEYTNSAINLPRYLYVSNNASAPVAHAAVTLPASSPFNVVDNCPSTLLPHSVCRLTIGYASPAAPSDDAVTLNLDLSLTVLVTGQTLPPTSATGSATNPSLSVSATTLPFSSPVLVTQVSSTQQSLLVSNTGASAFPLTATVTGDFQINSTCPATLPSGSSCNLYLNFAPSVPGTRDGLLTLTTTSGFAPTLVTLTGTASAILLANNGTLALGQTYAGEPIELFLRIQQSLPSLTAVASPGFGVAIVPNTGVTPTSLPASAFTASVTAACGNCTLAVEFLSQTPISATGTLTLTTVAAGNPYVLALSAAALPVTGLVLTPTQQDFGPVPVHSTSPAQTFTVTNLNADASTVTLTSIAASGDFIIAANTTGGPTCAGTLAPATSCFIQVQFAPTSTGTRSGTLTITTPATTLTSALTGYGAADPGLSLSPNALLFNLTPSVTAGTQTLTVGNTGSATLTLASPTTTTSSFTSSSACTNLAAGATCTITVNFAAAAASVSDTLSLPVTFTQNGQTIANVYTVPLTGTYTAQDSGLEILPSQVNFGAAPTGTIGSTRDFTLNNLTASSLNITLALPRQFPLVDGTACTALPAGGSCTFSVAALPATDGPITGTIFAQGKSQGGMATAQGLGYLLGYGTGSTALTITGFPIPNTPLQFAQLTSGQSSSIALTLANSGTTPLNIRRITITPPFYASSNCTAPLAASSNCNLTLTYAPTYQLASTATNLTPRTDTASLTIESDAVTSPVILPVSGTVAPTLSSSPSSSAVLNTYTLTQGSLTFPNTTVGNASATQTVTLTNNGSVVLHIASVTPTADYTATTICTTLAPGNACTITVAFSPTTATTTTTRAGSLEIASDAASSLDFITLFGTSSAAPLTLSPDALDFGTQNVASTTTLPLTIINTSAAPITLLSLNATGDYTTALNTCPAANTSLAAGASCTLTVAFTPTTTGARAGTLSLATSATTQSLNATLNGVGVSGQLIANPTALNFGALTVLSPSPLTLTLTNTGSALVTLSPATITGAADFAITGPCSITTLAPNQACTLTVTFTPSIAGARSATLTIPNNSSTGSLQVPLTGSGLASTGSFALTVGGGSTQTMTVSKGAPAAYALTLTPLNGFTGPVALTCAPVIPGMYIACSLQPATLTLAGTQLNATATLNTITTAALAPPLFFKPLTLLLALLVFPVMIKTRRRRIAALLSCIIAVLLTSATGCGGGGGSTNVLYTPPGTYQYTVTATSTTGPTVTSTVMLNLVVQ
jgi:hypothetical protein